VRLFAGRLDPVANRTVGMALSGRRRPFLGAEACQPIGIERHDAEQEVVEKLPARREQPDQQDERRQDAAREPEDQDA
jgi:hypothetical protein